MAADGANTEAAEADEGREEQHPAEADENAEEAHSEDAGDWREGDADFYDVLLADVLPQLPGPPVAEAVDLEEEEVRPQRLPLAKDATDVSTFFAGLQAKRDVPVAVVSDIISYINENRNLFADLLADSPLPNFRTMRARAARLVPQVRLDAVFRDTDNSLVTFGGRDSFPVTEMTDRQLTKEYVLYYVSTSEILDYHVQLHPDDPAPTYFDLSLDGIPESKSGGRSIDVLSIRYEGCRNIYSIALMQPARKGMGLPDDITLPHFLREYDESRVRLRHVIADAPKRAALSGLKQHSSNFACQYCIAEKEDRVYPWTSLMAEERTNEGTRRMAEAGDESLGVKRPSPLRQVESLDIIRHVPAEKLHLIDLGIVRKIIQLSFKCPQFKAKQVDFPRADDTRFNQALEAAPSLPNFSRRTRALDTANFKGEEYRNLGLAYWPIVKRYLPSQVADVWLLTVFIYRAVSLPDEAYATFRGKYNLDELLKAWYKGYEAAFGKQNCSYNTHTFSHVRKVRELGPLSETCAYAFEGHYNHLKKSYRPGTASTGKQALSNMLVAARHGHACAKKNVVTGKVTRKIDDSWCYVADVGVIKVSAATTATVQGRVMPTQAQNELLRGLDFNDVWSFALSHSRDALNLESETTYLLEDVMGKCVVVDGVASVLPWDVLHE